MADAIASVSWPWVLAATGGVILISAGKALRWRWLYPPEMSPLPWATHFSILMISQMLNLLAPLRLGEMARMGLMRQEQRPVGTTFGTIVVEKSVDLLTVQLLIVLAVPLAFLPDWLRSRAGIGALALGGGLLIGLVLVARFHDRMLAWLTHFPWPTSAFWARWVERAQRLLHTTLAGISSLDRPRLMRVVGLTAAIWLLSVAVLLVMLVAFRLRADWSAAFVLMIALTFSNWVPTPPAMIGVVGAVTVAVLASFGVLPAQALALGTVLNAVLVVPPVILGGWATWTRLWGLRTAIGTSRLNRALGLTPPEPPQS